MTFSKALKTLTCAFSALVLAGLSLASDLTEFRDAVAGAESEAQLEKALEKAPAELHTDGSMRYYFEESIEYLADERGWRGVKDDLLSEIASLEKFRQGPEPGRVADPKATAEEILSNPLYTDRREREGRNWLERAGTRLGDRMLEWLQKLLPDRMPQLGGLGLGSFGSAMTTIAWFLIGAVILLVVYFIVLNFRGVGKRKRRVGGILEDDEPERTADQWLEQADALEAAGKYREAVRCLYLACLVRYDDGRVARFRRHETNWEHLYRIEASERNPAHIDFRSATQKFDKVWYGKIVRGPEDVAEFKEVYTRLCEALQIKSAA
jgi:hypothetical protein